MQRASEIIDLMKFRRIVESNKAVPPVKYVPPQGASTPTAEICPTCKCPLSDTTLRWVKDYSTPEKYFNHRLVPCPTCSGEARKQRAARQQEELVARLFGTSQIPFHARTWTFSTFPQDADRAALAVVQDFIASHLAGDDTLKRGLYLGGAVGRGKTGLAVSALKEVMSNGHLGLFVMTLELMNRLRASYGKENSDNPDELLQTVTQVPWLVLDDIATERPTPYVLEQFYYIIEKRRSAGLYTIFTSNLSTKHLEEYWRPESVKPGDFHAGMRVVERLREYCQGIAVRGSNLREGAF